MNSSSKIILSLAFVSIMFLLPVHADSILSSLAQNPSTSNFTNPPSNGGAVGDCFAITQSATLTRVLFGAKSFSGFTITGTLQAELWSNPGNPTTTCAFDTGTLLAQSTNTLDVTTLSQSAFNTYTFTFPLTTITAGTYVIAIRWNNPAGSGTPDMQSNNVASNNALYECDSGASKGKWLTSGCEGLCNGIGFCTAYTLFGNITAPPQTLCGQGIQAEILGAGGLMVVLLLASSKIFMGGMKTDKWQRKLEKDNSKMFGVILVVAMAILFVALIFATGPAGGPC